jgi:hypothetical protein
MIEVLDAILYGVIVILILLAYIYMENSIGSLIEKVFLSLGYYSLKIITLGYYPKNKKDDLLSTIVLHIASIVVLVLAITFGVKFLI